MLDENFYQQDITIENNMVVFKTTLLNKPLTELRIIDFLEKTKIMVNSFYEPKIKKICLIYNIEHVTIPDNFQFIKDFCNIYTNNRQILIKKLQFTIIQSNNTIFNLFFNMFKKYYTPIKPLYFSKSDDETKICINDNESVKELDFS